MRRKYYYYYQFLFFAGSTFILHFALFDFIGGYEKGYYTSWNEFSPIFYNFLPVLVIDLIVAVGIGCLNCVCLLPLNNNLSSLKTFLILTDILWLLFCLSWFFSNRGVINVEAVGHLFSPFIVGFAGLVLALATLIFAVSFSKTKKN